MDVQPLAQGHVVVATVPAANLITDDPALVKLPSGRLLTTFTLRGTRGPAAQRNLQRFRIARSADEGQTWQQLTPLDINMGLPFVHDGTLYLLGNGLGREHIIISRSNDEGETWQPFSVLFRGSYWNAPTGTATRGNTWYRAFGAPNEAGLYNRLGSRCVVVAANLEQDLLNPSAWRMARELVFPGTPAGLTSRLFSHDDHWLEPNVVNVNGRIRVLLRTRIDQYATSSLGAVCDVSDDGERLELSFSQFYPLPGAQNKFHVIYDEESRLFWMTSNLPTNSQDGELAEQLAERGLSTPGDERRFLMLFYSVDALNWFQAACLAMWPSPLQSFNYVTQIVDGEDLLFVSRTSRDAPNPHASDLVTFHRLAKFRSLALDLYPRYAPGYPDAQQSRPMGRPRPLAQDHVVIHTISDPDVLSDAPSLLRLGDGRLLCAFSLMALFNKRDSFKGRIQGTRLHLFATRERLGDNTLLVFVSDDEGSSWRQVCEPLAFSDGRLFMREGKVYFLGVGPLHEGILITRSDDRGATWLAPVTLFEGIFFNTSTGMAEREGTLYWAFGTPNKAGLGNSVGSRSMAVAADLSKDLMDPASWRISAYLTYPGTPEGLTSSMYEHSDHYLEPNVVNVNGRIRALLRPRLDRCATANMAVVCDIHDDGATLDYRFTQFHPLPGGQNHFHIVYDSTSRLFWMTSNLPTNTQDEAFAAELAGHGFLGKPGNERRFLMLFYSVDALNWFQAGCIARWPSPLQAFNYATPLIDGEEMLVVCRTSKEGRNQHDNDLVTFHRIENFRSLALDLQPAASMQ